MSKTLCVLPWMHLASHPNGGQSLCCRSNHTHAVSWAMKPGTQSLQMFDDTSLAEMANSETFVRVRQAMLDGKRPIECEGCWRDEDAGIESKRQYENKRWAHIVPQLEQSAVLEKPNYRYVELRLGNVCNLACITCNSYSSSKWYNDEAYIAKRLPWFKLRPQENFKWFENPAFYEQLQALSTDVEEIYINGGEPTLIKAHFAYLDRLIEAGQASKVHLVYSLNMTDIPDRLVELWSKFKRVTINCSIDDLGERNKYIRWATNWDDVVASLDKLNTIPTVEWSVTTTVSILNVFTFHELSDWLQSKYNKPIEPNYVLYPDYLSFAALPPSIKQEIKALYADKLSSWQRDELFAKLALEHDPALTTRAREFILALDKSRGTDFRTYLPKLQGILE